MSRRLFYWLKSAFSAIPILIAFLVSQNDLRLMFVLLLFVWGNNIQQMKYEDVFPVTPEGREVEG